MPIATRSKTRGDPVNAQPPKSANRKSAVQPGKVQKDPEAAREHGTHLLQTLQEEQEREIQDALGIEGHGGCSNGRGTGRGRGHGHGHGRGHSHGHSRGCGGGHMGGTKSGKESETPAVEDATPAAIPEADGLDEPVGHLFAESANPSSHSNPALQHRPSHSG